LEDSYPSAGRARPNRSTATALLARVYLYIEDYSHAEYEATEVIRNTSQYRLVDLDSVFLNGSKEAIWQLLPKGGTIKYTYEGINFIQVAVPAATSLRNDLYTSFERDDRRRVRWVDSISSTSGLTKWFFARKYKETYGNAKGSESSMVFRLAELYLIRAEARAMQGNIGGDNSGESDLNEIRRRAGLRPVSSVSQDELLQLIGQERRVELFTEWGHRFFDLKRTGQLNAVLSVAKPYWDDKCAFLPLPLAEIMINGNLTQNNGY
jgi:starch-binding outer membrane protein, SusD/RagB family